MYVCCLRVRSWTHRRLLSELLSTFLHVEFSFTWSERIATLLTAVSNDLHGYVTQNLAVPQACTQFPMKIGPKSWISQTEDFRTGLLHANIVCSYSRCLCSRKGQLYRSTSTKRCDLRPHRNQRLPVQAGGNRSYSNRTAHNKSWLSSRNLKSWPQSIRHIFRLDHDEDLSDLSSPPSSTNVYSTSSTWIGRQSLFFKQGFLLYHYWRQQHSWLSNIEALRKVSRWGAIWDCVLYPENCCVDWYWANLVRADMLFMQMLSMAQGS